MNNTENDRTALVSFIDILGFSNIVEKNQCNEVFEILKKFHWFSKPDDKMSVALQEETEYADILATQQNKQNVHSRTF